MQVNAIGVDPSSPLITVGVTTADNLGAKVKQKIKFSVCVHLKYIKTERIVISL